MDQTKTRPAMGKATTHLAHATNTNRGMQIHLGGTLHVSAQIHQTFAVFTLGSVQEDVSIFAGPDELQAIIDAMQVALNECLAERQEEADARTYPPPTPDELAALRRDYATVDHELPF